MKIYVNGRFLTQRITGVQRVGIEVLKELDKIVEEDLVEVLIPPGIVNEIKLDHIRITTIGKKSNNYWVQVTLPLYVKKNNGVLLTMAGLCPILCPDYLVAHDAIFIRFPQTFSKSFVLSYKICYHLALKRCKRIFTISNFSKNELINAFGVEESKFVIISNSSQQLLNQQYEYIPVEKWGLKRNEYYLSVSSQTIHKNQKYIFDCANKYPERIFVIVGGNPKTFVNVDKSEAPNLKYTGYVSNNELYSLYKGAKGFIFPSLYEGFGMPPLEAITMGVRHIGVSNIEVFREIYNRGVYYFNPNDIRDFNINELDSMYVTDDDFKYYLNQYSWKRTAEAIYKTIKP